MVDGTNRLVACRNLMLPTGRWTFTGQNDAMGEPIARPEIQEIATGQVFDGARLTPSDLGDYLAEGIVAPVGSPAALEAQRRGSGQ